MTADAYDAIVVGAGRAGEVAVWRPAEEGLRVAPLAGQWIHDTALATKTGTPLAGLKDAVAQFPTLPRHTRKASHSYEHP